MPRQQAEAAPSIRLRSPRPGISRYTHTAAQAVGERLDNWDQWHPFIGCHDRLTHGVQN